MHNLIWGQEVRLDILLSCFCELTVRNEFHIIYTVKVLCLLNAVWLGWCLARQFLSKGVFKRSALSDVSSGILLSHLNALWSCSASIYGQIDDFFWEKDFFQVSHVNGLFPVSPAVCLIRLRFSVKYLLQTLQVNGLTPVCKNCFWDRSCLLRKDSLHISMLWSSVFFMFF